MGSPILIVDDDEVLGQILARVLQRAGYDAVHAASLDAAVRLARDRPPRLAIIDLCLPDGNGRDAARLVREVVPNVTCILMTAFPLRLRDHPELSDDFASVLFKPLDLMDLRKAIAAALESPHALRN